ncbi:MAG: RNA polymerase sigma factor [Thermaerobacter sp.]|nr:RNA polymerase sigma factor [Thermaerobacter sp.]
MNSQRERDFEAFYRREERRVLRLCYGVLGDPGLAQDAAQEAWIRYLRYADGPRPQFSVPLLVTVALNAARDWERRRRRRPEDLHADMIAFSTAIEPDDRDLLDAVSKLPVQERGAVLMHYALDMPIGEVAAVLQKRSGAVKSMLHRARGHLRSLLTPEEEISHGR